MTSVSDLLEGDVINYGGEVYTLEHIKSNFYTFFHDTERPLTLTISEVHDATRSGKLSIAKAQYQFSHPARYSLKDRENAINIMRLSHYFKDKKNIKSKDIQEYAKKNNLRSIGKTQLYEYLRKAKKYGWQVETFVPRHHQKGCKKPRYQSFLTIEAEKYIDTYYLTRSNTTIISVYRSFKGYCAKSFNLDESDIPSHEWFRKQINRLPQHELIKKREGGTSLKQAIRSYFNEFDVSNIKDRVEFDFYSPQVPLITIGDGQEEISTRLFFCVAIDTYSNMPLAIVTLSERGESSSCFRLCVKKAMSGYWISTKTGNVIDCRGIIYHAVTDAGAGFLCENLTKNLFAEFRTMVMSTEVKAPYRKPFVENFIRQIKNRFEVLLPGSYKNIRDNGTRDMLKAKKGITVEQYLHDLQNWIVDSYVITKQTGRTQTPIQIWEESCMDIKQKLPDDFDARFARSGTLESGMANYLSGINKFYTFYNSPELQKITDIKRSTELEYYVDPLDVSSIYVINPETSNLLKVPSIKPVVPEGTPLDEHLKMVRTLRQHTPIEACIAEHEIREEALKSTRRVKSESSKKPKSNALQDKKTGYEVEELTEELLNEIVNADQGDKEPQQQRITHQPQDDDYGMTTFTKK
ncbi:DNA-binding domain-containing protein [Photobacterium sp. J15]|uniref:DNA-binding domain-containing protein n=1 Tax=Photobacterium sp. J15 TaxID=265901 RepID=UPI0007E4BD81|nr:DNA-binding domain-containing protein [Photobacterium sp. J15]